MKITTLENFSVESIGLNEGLNDNKLILNIIAIHKGMTRNLTDYTDNALKSSLNSWTKPYEKKVLKNHDIHAEPLGRVLAANYDFDKNAGRDAVILTVELSDPDAIQKVMDKRYTTVSVGGTSDSVTCSICGTDIAREGMCEHYKGEMYDGDMCRWIIQTFEPDEISFVNAPADIYAGVAGVEDDPMKMPQGHQHMHQSFDGAGNPIKTSESDSKEGGQEMTKAEAEKLQSDLAEALAKVTELETKVTEANENIADKDAKLAEAQTSLEESKTNLDEANSKVEELTANVNTLNESNETLTQEVATVKSEKEALEAQVVEVRTENHKLLAEKVAIAKVVLGKITKEDFEAEVNELTQRTAESLSDSLSDLLKGVVASVEKLDDPTKTGADKHVNESVEFEDKKTYADYLSNEIRNLFN